MIVKKTNFVFVYIHKLARNETNAFVFSIKFERVIITLNPLCNIDANILTVHLFCKGLEIKTKLMNLTDFSILLQAHTHTS